MKMIYLFLLQLLFAACKHNSQVLNAQQLYLFSQPVKVEMKGYSGNMMEPFLSRDGNTLFFNNLNSAPENTNLHWAIKINDSSFQYNGEIAGVNTRDLEGVPTLDRDSNLYFVSTRNYSRTLSTLYQCHYSNGIGSNVHLVNGVSKLMAGWVNFDIEVSADGQSLYFVDSKFDQSGNPSSADLVIAQKKDSGFERQANTDYLMHNINTEGLEYAASISADNLVLFFTRVDLPLNANSTPVILYATRKSISDPFSVPSKVQSITGFAEGPSISADQHILYYHKKENDHFVLYMVREK
jgi:hypothetical protein